MKVIPRKYRNSWGSVGGKAAEAAWYSQFKAAGIVRAAGGGSRKRDADVADDWMQEAKRSSLPVISNLWAQVTGAQLASEFNAAARRALATHGLSVRRDSVLAR